MKKIVECVPNFSAGRDKHIVYQIAKAIDSVNGVSVLHVDSGYAVDRTVITFAGELQAVGEAAFCGIRKAALLIDMEQHKGEHPRIGATDVCPFVPVVNTTMDETVTLARNLAKRVGNELGIPVYCYEFAAFTRERRKLEYCRRGEYEGLAQKITTPEGKPDFGPAVFHPKSGASIIGARNFLAAYNINLKTKSVAIAKRIAKEIRESGYIVRRNNEIVRTTEGKPLRKKGTLRNVKAIGWYIAEYGHCQVSMNITDLAVTPLHAAFEEVCRCAANHNVEVTGSELIGLIPLKAMMDTGDYYHKKYGVQNNASAPDFIHTAIKFLGLSDIQPFATQEKIIEYVLKNRGLL